MQKDSTHPEKVAAEFNMQLVRADGLEAGNPIPGVGASTDFDQSIATLKKGEVSQPVALPGDKIAVAILTDVIPPRPATFEEVESKVRDSVVQIRTQRTLQKHAQELLDKAKAMGGDLVKAAKSMGKEAKTANAVGPTSTVEGLGSLSFMVDVFGRPDGTLFGPFTAADGTVVGKVVQNVPVDVTQLAAERNSLRDEIKTQKARDRAVLFEAGLRDRLTQEGKIKIHQDVIQRLVADFVSNKG